VKEKNNNFQLKLHFHLIRSICREFLMAPTEKLPWTENAFHLNIKRERERVKKMRKI